MCLPSDLTREEFRHQSKADNAIPSAKTEHQNAKIGIVAWLVATAIIDPPNRIAKEITSERIGIFCTNLPLVAKVSQIS